MAIGDIVGDLATAYLTPAQRAAKNGTQSMTGGPIARASGQAATVGAVAGGLAAAPGAQSDQYALNPNPQHLGDIYKNPAQLAQPPQATSLASLRPVGVTPTATSPTYPTNSQAMASLSDGLRQSTSVTAPGIQQPIDAVTAGRSSLNLNQALAAPAPALESNAAQPIDNTYRLTGTGTGSNSIAARVGADGVPEFSNQDADLAGARMQGQINNTAPSPASLADLRPGGRAADPSAPFASLGSASNLGDGIGGGLSVGAPGDSQLALTRFQRANDIRALGAAQDRADLANYRANQSASIGIVRDSSKPVTRSDLAAAQLDQQKQAGLVQNAGRAQQSLEDLRTGQAAAAQTRRSQSLEDAWTLATAPNATDEAKQRYQALSDPTGAGAQARQLAAANIAEKEATTRKITAETNALGGPGKLTEQQAKDLQYFARANAANAELAKYGNALTASPTGGRGYVRSGLDTALRALPVVGNSGIVNSLVSDERQQAEQSSSELINALLRKDSGAALTETEMATYGRTYVPQAGDGEAVLKQKQAAVTRAIQGIKDGLGSAAILAAETNRPEYRSASANAGKTASPPQALRVKGPEDVMGLPSGTVFIGPDGKTRRIP